MPSSFTKDALKGDSGANQTKNLEPYLINMSIYMKGGNWRRRMILSWPSVLETNAAGFETCIFEFNK